jgi:hypothetical protein
MPVFPALVRASNNVDHVLSWVDARRAWRFVTSKISLDCICIVADVTKVNGLTTFCEKKERIELAEELCAWPVGCRISMGIQSVTIRALTDE